LLTHSSERAPRPSTPFFVGKSRDPFSGNVLAAQRWDQLDPGARAVSVIYPLHTGELGGPLLMTVLGVGGLALFGLSVTGVWQWWRRRKARRVPSGTRNR
jgi:uncharacterized iron-regulated membrane protein